MTTRERKQAKADRLRGWADKRETTANRTLNRISERYRGDHAFNTQPGHIPERARTIRQEDAAFTSFGKAADMTDRADGIERQLDRSIYSDDPDAIERLQEKIAKLEEKADRRKRINTAYRKDPEAMLAMGLDPSTIASMTDTMNKCPWMKSPLDTTHTRAEIRRCKKRITDLSSPIQRWRMLTVKYAGECDKCEKELDRGVPAFYCKTERLLRCRECFGTPVVAS